MKSSELQEAARQRNWALFQIKACRGNLYRAMQQAHVNIDGMDEWLDMAEEAVKEAYRLRRDWLLQQQIQQTLEKL